MNHLLFSRYSYPSLGPQLNHPRNILPNNRGYTLSSPVLVSYTKKTYNYPLAYHPLPHPYTFNNNPSINYNTDNYNRTDLILIAILILTSIDLIFIRPRKTR